MVDLAIPTALTALRHDEPLRQCRWLGWYESPKVEQAKPRPRRCVRCSRGALCAARQDLTQSNGLGPYLALKFIAECGDDLSAWPSAKHYLLLCLAPSNKISGGKVLSSRTRRYGAAGKRRS